MQNYNTSQVNLKFIQQNASTANTPKAKVQQINTLQNTKSDNTKDTFVSQYKKELITGGILGSIGIFTGLFALAKKGYLGSSLQDIVNKIFKNKTQNLQGNIKPKKTDTIPQTKPTPVKKNANKSANKTTSTSPDIKPKKTTAKNKEKIKKSIQKTANHTPISAKNESKFKNIISELEKIDFKNCSEDDISKISDELSKNLNTDDRKTAFNLIKSVHLFNKNANIDDFPILLNEKENEILKTIINSNLKLDEKQTKYLQKLTERNLELGKISDEFAQLIYSTPFNTNTAIKNSNGIMRANPRGFETDGYGLDYKAAQTKLGKTHREATLEWDKGRQYPVLNLTKLKDTEDLSKFGFPKGIKKSDLRFYVHMVEDYHLKDIPIDPKSFEKLWSKSFISPNYRNTFLDRNFGVITVPKIGQMHTTYIDGRKTGYDKTITRGLKALLTDDIHKENLSYLPDFIKKELNLTDKEYIKLVQKLKTTENIFSDTLNGKTIDIDNKKFDIETLRSAIKNSQDKLFNTYTNTLNDSENNEILDETCDIIGAIIRYSGDKLNTDSLDYTFERGKAHLANFIDDFKAKTGKTLPIFII